MFTKSGEKLKGLAVVNFAVGCVGLFIYFISRLIHTQDSGTNTFVSFLIALAILGVGVFALYIESLFIHAFGTLVDSSERSADSDKHTEALLSNLDKNLQYLRNTEALLSNLDKNLQYLRNTKVSDAQASLTSVGDKGLSVTPVQPSAPDQPAAPENAPAKKENHPQSSPAAAQAVTEEKMLTYKEHLAYAAKYHTVSGMRGYLQSITADKQALFSNEEKRNLQALLHLPDMQLQQKISEL